MKNLITKIISILVIMLMMINSSLLLVISVAVDELQKIIDESKINAIYELNMEKYVNYKVGESQGTLIQALLKTGIEYQEGQEYVPIEETILSVNTPKINDKYPENVEVVTKSTKATNGDVNGKDVSYTYNKENGQLEILAENIADENGNIYAENVDGARDEYQLNLYYDADCYNGENVKRTLDFTGKLELKLKDDERDIRKSQDIVQNFEVAENISGLVSADVTTSDIYNGYINSNIQNNTEYRTEYTENMKIQVSYKEISDEININTKNLFINNENKEIETQDVVYKSTKVNKNEVLDKVGENGTLQIVSKDGNVLLNINKDTEADENGNIQVTYENEQTELNIKLSKPVKLGDIYIQNVKQIKETMRDVNVAKVETKNTISCVNNVTEIKKIVDEETNEEKEIKNTNQVEVYNFTSTNVSEIKAAKTDVKITADNTEWTNNMQNDVVFTATLVTAGPENSLFKNPVIDIKLPEEVEKVVLGESSILYDNRLQIDNVEVVDVEGSKIIRVKVNGNQTSYIKNEIVNGANIIIPASVILKKDIASTQEKIDVSFANYRNVKIPETGSQEIPVNVSSIVNNTESSNEIYSVNNYAFGNYNSTGLASVAAEGLTDNSESDSVAQTIDLDRISVEYKAMIGDTELADGDSVHEDEYIKYVAKVRNNTGEDFNGLNVIASVPEGTTYIEVIYGDLREGTYDRCRIDEYPERKEVTSNISLKNDEEKEISFYVKVNKLESNTETLNIKTSIKVQNGENEKIFNEINNVVKDAKIDVNLSAWITALANNVWLYQVTVVNNTSETIENVKVSLDMGGKFVLTEDESNRDFTQKGNKIEYTIESIRGKNDEISEDGSLQNEYTRFIYLTAITQDKNMEFVNSYVTVSYNDSLYYSEPNVQKVNYPDFEIIQSSDKEGEILKYGEEIEYVFKIKNNSNIVEKINVEFEDYLEKNMKPISIEYENYILVADSGTYTEEKQTIEEELEGRIGDSESEIVTKKILYIPNGKEITVKIKAIPNAVLQRTEVTNYARITFNYNGEKVKTSNRIKNIILPYDYVEPDPDNPNPDNPDPDNPDPDNPDPDNPDPDNPDPDNPNPDNPNPDNPDPDNPNLDNPNIGKYSISGLVWKDENKNGIRENTEILLSGMTVKLFNIDTNEIVVINNTKQIITTDADGKYMFSGLNKGNYIVLFEYNTNKYKLTTYRIYGSTEETDSNTINKSVSIDGIEKNVGVTDTISISNQNKTHIDMGLIEKGTYNISLNKYITNVKVIYETDEENYSYDKSKLVKVEIPAKKLNGTKMIVEYNIEVKNQGDKSVSVDSIVDYKPDGWDFSRENNSQWSIDANNVISYNTLSGKMIKPGESENVKIYFTKNLTKDNLGTFNNTAEILKVSDEEESENVNKKSQAELIVSVKTGGILYIGIIIVALIIFISLLLIFNKNMKRGTKKLKLILILSISIIGVICGVSIWDKVQAVECWHASDNTYTIGDVQYNAKSETKGSGDTADKTYYTYGYYSHDHYINGYTIPAGELFCTDGKEMGFKNRNGTGSTWTYTHTSNVSYSYSVTGYKYYNKASISKQDTTINADVKSSNYIIGPFKVKYNGTIGDYILEGKNSKDEVVTLKNPTICDSNGNGTSIESETDFYVKVPIDSGMVKSSLFKINCSSKGIEWTKGKVTYTQEWKTSSYKKEKGDAQILHKPAETHDYNDFDKSDESSWIYSSKKDFSAYVEIPMDLSFIGKITINKNDADTNDSLVGAKFQVTGPNEYNETFTIEKGGTLTIDNLLIGSYTITEVGAPTNYNVSLQDNTTATVNVTGGGTASTTIYNKQYGNLKVVKYDEDTGNTSIGGNKLQGIQFKLYIMKNGTKQYLRNATLTKYAYSDFNVNEANKSTAKTFTTDSNAQFTVDNLPVYEGKEQITYYIEEYSLPDNLKDYYDVKVTSDTVTLSNGKTESKKVNNKQQYVKISGFVWEDKTEGKNSIRNDLYDSKNNEPLVEGITVRLKDKQNNGAIVQETKTDSNGKYTLKRVDKDKLSNYYVEFEYNGLKYESVTYKTENNGSKAIEGATSRNNFNNSFATIFGGNEKGNETIGYSKNTSGNVTNDLKYKNGEYSSSLVQNTDYTVEKAKESVIARNDSTGAAIKASTDVSGYSLNTWKSGITEIKDINLGIYLREQPDIAVATDIDNIQLSINGYTHTYNYKQRENYIKGGIPDKNINPGYDAIMDGFNVNIKNKTTGNYKDLTYTREIYDSYIAYTKNDPTRTDKLRMFVTYKIVVKNESGGLIERVSLRNYVDSQYKEEIVSSKVDDGTNIVWTKNGDVTWKDGGVTKKSNIWQTDLINKDIKPGECMTIYLQYELSTDAIVELANLKENEEFILNKNITEITSYSTWKDKKVYAGIDIDSAPDNITYNNISTYEDDTDAAPDLKIKRKDSKEISGLVFEDSTDSNLMTAQERKGTGTYDNEDKPVKDVDVQIIDYNNKNTIKLYSLDDSGNAIERDAQSYTDNNGEYSFVGLIPGEYYIQYIYGSYKDYNDNTKQTVIKSGNSDISVTTQDYKSTIVDDSKFKTLIENNIENERGYNTIKANFDKNKNTDALWYWYQNTNNSTNSSAVDNSEWRRMINEKLENIDYSVKNTYDNKLDIEQSPTNYYMIANTGIMDIPVEDIRNQVTDYNYQEGQRDYQIKFGIVERPRQSVQVNKEISYLRLVLANGQILVQGDPRIETINYVTYPEGGSLKLEIDNEIIKGATLNLDYEITVENKSELDYNDINYYRYGNNYDESKLVKIKLNSLADYVDQKLSITYDIGSEGSELVYYNSSETITDRWQLIQKPSAEKDKLAGINIDSNVYEDIKNRSNIVVRNTNIETSPLDTQKIKFYLTAKKLLTDIGQEDQIYDNFVELIKVSNSVGRFYGEMVENNTKWKLRTPGNFNVTKVAETNECDNSGYNRNTSRNAQLIIIPPTGGKPTAMYYIIGISCLVILTVGIILIKKKVLD